MKQKISKSERERQKYLKLKESGELANHTRLADEVLMSLYNPQNIATYSINRYDKNWEKTQENKRQFYIQEMSRVPKFQVSNDLIENIIKTSFNKPSRLFPSFLDALPPYGKVWIEWNEKERMKLNDKIVNDGIGYYDLRNVSDRVGYFLETMVGKDGKRGVIFSQFSSANHTTNNQLIIMPYGFLFHYDDELIFDLQTTIEIAQEEGYSEEYLDQWRNGNTKQYAKQYREGQLELMETLLGDNYMLWNKRKNRDVRNSKPFKDISKHVQRYSHSMASLVYSQHQMQEFQTGSQWEKWQDENGHFHSLFNGDGRFLFTLLSVLNSSERIHSNTVLSSQQLDYTKKTKRVPKSEYKMLDISLPHITNTSVPNPNADGSPKRYHQRRGHWRRLPNGQRVWIKDKWVGNQKLGTIYHDYNLTKKAS